MIIKLLISNSWILVLANWETVVWCNLRVPKSALSVKALRETWGVLCCLTLGYLQSVLWMDRFQGEASTDSTCYCFGLLVVLLNQSIFWGKAEPNGMLGQVAAVWKPHCHGGVMVGLPGPRDYKQNIAFCTTEQCYSLHLAVFSSFWLVSYSFY